MTQKAIRQITHKIIQNQRITEQNFYTNLWKKLLKPVNFAGYKSKKSNSSSQIRAINK